MRIHYFQRYHSKENVDTANTMLMLSRLYSYSADKFFMFFNTHILNEDKSPELTIEMQEKKGSSVPDAVISQKSFKIIVETKLHNQFVIGQLKNHLAQFGNEDIKVLLTIDPYKMKRKLFEELQNEIEILNEKNIAVGKSPIKHINITFEELVTAIEDVITDKDLGIADVFEDYKNYCFEQNLISNKDKWMRAITAKTTFNDNVELGLYYDKETRSFSQHGYIGLYKDKSIRAIGQLTKTIIAHRQDGKLIYKGEHEVQVSENELAKINEAIDRAKKYGYDLENVSHRYFFVDKFYPTDFKKDSNYPIQKSKFFNLAEILDCKNMPDTNTIADTLNGKKWEDFS